jgi:hypothetical protein
MTSTNAETLPDTSVNIGFLVGDVNGVSGVTATDLRPGQVRFRSSCHEREFPQRHQHVGTITSTDIGIVKSRSGNTLP